jgi:TRAP-type mannitol/chloroaromatic compound transport system permease small subunit
VRIVFAAFVFLAIPFCIASIYLEYRVARRRFPEIDAGRLYMWARTANIYSYACIVVIAAIYTLIQWHRTA